MPIVFDSRYGIASWLSLSLFIHKWQVFIKEQNLRCGLKAATGFIQSYTTWSTNFQLYFVQVQWISKINSTVTWVETWDKRKSHPRITLGDSLSSKQWIRCRTSDRFLKSLSSCACCCTYTRNRCESQFHNKIGEMSEDICQPVYSVVNLTILYTVCSSAFFVRWNNKKYHLCLHRWRRIFLPFFKQVFLLNFRYSCYSNFRKWLLISFIMNYTNKPVKNLCCNDFWLLNICNYYL